jgi:hypothetical protein
MKTFKVLSVVFSAVLFFSLSLSLRAQLPNIMSLQISPVNPTEMDTVKLTCTSQFASGGCTLTSSSVNFAPGQIDVNAFHMLGPLAYICSSTDVFTLGILPAGQYTLYYHLSCGPYTGCYDLDSISFTVQLYTIIESPDNAAGQLVVYPVLSGDRLNITLPDHIEKVNLGIFEMTGRKAFSFIAEHSIKEYDISSLSSGIYLIEGSCGKERILQKFIKH